MGHVLMTDGERAVQYIKSQESLQQFDDRTNEFLGYLFEKYGIKQAIVPGTQ